MEGQIGASRQDRIALVVVVVVGCASVFVVERRVLKKTHTPSKK
jgi:hypothetical protein